MAGVDETGNKVAKAGTGYNDLPVLPSHANSVSIASRKLQWQQKRIKCAVLGTLLHVVSDA